MNGSICGKEFVGGLREEIFNQSRRSSATYLWEANDGIHPSSKNREARTSLGKKKMQQTMEKLFAKDILQLGLAILSFEFSSSAQRSPKFGKAKNTKGLQRSDIE